MGGANSTASISNQYMAIESGNVRQDVAGVGFDINAKIRWYYDRANNFLTSVTYSSADGFGGSPCNVQQTPYYIQKNGVTILSGSGNTTNFVSVTLATGDYLTVSVSIRATGYSGADKTASITRTIGINVPAFSDFDSGTGVYNVSTTNTSYNFYLTYLPYLATMTPYKNKLYSIQDNQGQAGSRYIRIANTGSGFTDVPGVYTNYNRTVVYYNGTYWVNYKENVYLFIFNAVPGLNLIPTNNAAIVGLPSASVTYKGQLFIIKDKSSYAGTNNITIFTGADALDEDRDRGTDTVLNFDGAALTLTCAATVSGGSTYGWYILQRRGIGTDANGNTGFHGYGNISGTLPTGVKRVTAAIGKVNIFNVNANTANGNSTARQSGDNCMNIPDATAAGQMIIVVYAGNASAKSYGNALWLYSANYRIETLAGFVSPTSPYLLANEQHKNSAAVLISGPSFTARGGNTDAGVLRWYLIATTTGHSNWILSQDTGDATTSTTAYGRVSASSQITIDLADRSDATNGRLFLPRDPSAATKSFLIVKQRIQRSYGMILYSDILTDDRTGVHYTTNVFNENQYRIYNAYTNWNQYNCLWLVGETRSTGKVHWYFIGCYFRY